MKVRPSELTQPLDLSRGTRIGPQRLKRPTFVDLLPPCNDAFPAGENIQGWLAYAASGRYKKAWQLLMIDNPLPAVHGRVCYHPCESNCNREQLDASVSIHAVERFLGDQAIHKDWSVKWDAKPSGKRVLIVGAGPSGLSAAYHLTRMGHRVEIHEAGPLAGGMMHFGIPAYRLPRDVLDYEIRRIEDMGVKIVLNHRVVDLLSEMKEGAFDATFVAVGAQISKRIDIPSRDAGKMLDAISFLKNVERGNPPKLGRRVAIYGGGNTAMDAARVAQRLGAEETLIIYRRDRNHMPAHDFEVDEAVTEGVKINWLRTIKQIDHTQFKVEVMEVDEAGRPRPTGIFETLEADALIMALGQDVDTEFLRAVSGVEFAQDGTVVVDEQMMTGQRGLFAGGDMVPSERTVTVAVGHGKKAARYVDAFLRGRQYKKPPKHKIVGFESLRVWYFKAVDQRTQGFMDASRRTSGFAEVVHGLTEREALFEARRCLSCGNCFECDGCYGACPEDAIVKLKPGKRYRFDYERCTGCAVCFEQCPCHAIEMIPEPENENE